MDLSDFDKGLIVMARQLGYIVSKMAGFLRCSWYAVVITYKLLSKERQLVKINRVSCPKLIDACGERRLALQV